MMTRQKNIGEISLLGGHPALDFVNTVDSRGERWGPEFLNSYSDLVSWAGRLEVIDDEEQRILLSLATKSPSEAERELFRARELRETLHRIFLTEVGDEPVRMKDLELLDQIARRAQAQRRLVNVGEAIEWRQSPADHLDAISTRVGWLAADLLTSRRNRRPIRACEGPNCGWLFLDHSRNGHRRWCSDRTCGSHARVRKFRAVRAE
ncbi:putative stress-induced transcription regulator [Rhizobium sp. ERR 1071]|uniref:CGNR zinc finger domain-containing protein n=1 Tax=Rhizobium sp. ERR 1071 TaxID=2572677 RepID=UPI001199AAAC|nr:ABATE domain-containing protein [Rhizobium sp. ERR1071]TWB11967.1 putative stress-induced transcription regulator [Rhizobium sp. ERR1071]